MTRDELAQEIWTHIREAMLGSASAQEAKRKIMAEVDKYVADITQKDARW